MLLKSITSILKLTFVTLLVSAFASTSFASVDMFLLIKNEKGKVVSRCEVSNDGSFSCPTSLTKGTYTMTLEWSLGESSASSSTPPKSGRAASSSSSTPSTVMCTYEVKSPRDAASGQATGKRQHKPMTITTQLDKSSPMLSKKTASISVGELTIDNDCDGISGKLSSKNNDGKSIDVHSWSWGESNR